MSICWKSGKPYLIERWNSGCHNAAQLWREIAQQGFPGKMTTLRSLTAQLRQAAGLPPRTCSAAGRPLTSDPTQGRPTLRGLTWLALRQHILLAALGQRWVTA